MNILDFILHIDKYLAAIITYFGSWTYVILFAIIFAETGLVVAPFLPGDSLIFAVGTLAGGGLLNIWVVYVTVLVAAILGDTVNYRIGQYVGPKVFKKENSRIFKQKYLDKTEAFYEKYGVKTIVLARFLPIVRTFAPFVAGIGNMNYGTFFLYNVIGAFIWVTSLTFAGYFLGALPFVKENFEYAVLAIVIFSVVPMILEYLKHRRSEDSSSKATKHTSYGQIRNFFKKKSSDK
ncbi:DedA family protein [bacterium]|nr:DedA family protein [bacterium]